MLPIKIENENSELASHINATMLPQQQQRQRSPPIFDIPFGTVLCEVIAAASFAMASNIYIQCTQRLPCLAKIRKVENFLPAATTGTVACRHKADDTSRYMTKVRPRDL